MKKQVRKLVSLSLVAGSLIMVSCGDSKKENAEAEAVSHTEMEHEMHEEKEEVATAVDAEFSDAKVKQAFTQYISLKDALVGTDAAAAKEAAKQLEGTLSENNAEISKIAGNIATTEDVNKQREMFSKLTAKLEPVFKGAISSGKIYKQFCPMAFEGKGDSWYSTSEEIRNPYFGDKMLKCGRVEETIM
ncbi:DUF3347 domain-containing protein [Christiangramia aquimixticola]|uniref:DUF3347 domain-containing protein n=1 Tax=Christiangramia aquimixticola TaxID=1697558 RepID=UPI003AA8253A